MLASDGRRRRICLQVGKREVTCRGGASALGLCTYAGRQTRGSDQPSRRTSGWPTAGYKTTIRDERDELTDGWNYEKVVVGSNLRTEVRMKSGHSVWAKYREASEAIDLNGLFSDYWSSNNHEFTVLSQSLLRTCPRRSD